MMNLACANINRMGNAFEDRIQGLIAEWLSNGRTQAELAKRIGVSTATISNWKKGGATQIYPKNLVKAAEVFGVNVTWLVTGKGSREPSSYAQNGADLELLVKVVTLVLEILKERRISLPSNKVGKVIAATYEDAMEDAFPPRRARILRLVQVSQ